MTRSQKIAFIVLIALLAVGTFLHWFISWPSTDSRDTAFSYLALVATLVGFAATVYQLRETERSIQESNQKPAIQIQVLPPSEDVGGYSSEETHQLAFYRSNRDDSTLEARCAFRVTNTGDRAASQIYLTFVFRPMGWSADDPRGGGLTVEYDTNRQSPYAVDSYGDTRESTLIGYTIRFPNLVTHADPYDRPIVAYLRLTMKATDLKPDYTIYYRIQSYEGNKLLESLRDKKTRQWLDQTCLISFVRADELPSGTHIAVALAGPSTGSTSMHG
jgi:hypothetical protein